MNTENETQTATETTAQVAKSPICAILHKNPAVFRTLQEDLTSELPTSRFVHVTKLSQVPENDGEVTVVSVGLPNYLSGKEPMNVISWNTQFFESQAEKENVWDTLKDENASTDEIRAVLSGHTNYKIIPEASLASAQLAYAKNAMASIKCTTDAERLASLQERLDIVEGATGFSI